MIEKKTTTTCSYCGVGCGIEVTQSHKGRLEVEGVKDHPVNQGMLCSKGRNLNYVAEDVSDRILYPRMRLSKSHPMNRVSWDSALDRTSKVFKSLIQKYGPDSVGFYVSGQCLTEEYYLINKLAKAGVGTNNIDTNSRLCMSSAVVGYKMALGEDAVPIGYEDIELADCFFITGANPAWCHPILFRRLEAHKEKNPNVKVIVCDPRKTQSCDIADVHLQINPGTDVYANQLLARLVVDNGHVDNDFVTNKVEGWETLKEELLKIDKVVFAEQCGVELALIEEAAKYIGEATGFITMWAMGLNQSVIGVNKNLSLLNLSLITGSIGKPGNGPFSLTGQPNAMGGREVGGMSNLLPAHRDLGNPEHRKEVADFWGVDAVPSKPGLTATQMFEAIESGELKAIWIVCTNPLHSGPNARLIEKALKKAKFVVVQDISENSTLTAYADVVLPAASWLEKEGTMTNSERRVSYLNKVIDPPGEAKEEIQIFMDFAKKMGYKGFDFSNAEKVFNEHAQLTKGTNIDVSELTYGHLQEKGSVQWPFKNGQGTTRLFEDHQFYTANKKANVFYSAPNNESELPSEEYPLIMTSGRVRDQWHTRTKTGKVERLNQHINQSFCEIHPKDALVRSVKEGDVLKVASKFGEIQVVAKVTDTIKQGVVFVPMHWGKTLNNDATRTNNLTSDLKDPKSNEPDYKFVAVQVVQFKKKKEKIAIVGAGAGAYRFISKYRESNLEDEIIVFSKEKYPFYNRVQLPDYVSGEKEWKSLIKIDDKALDELNVKVKSSCAIHGIDRDRQIVKDAEGNEFPYDKLILATGSRANLPKGLPTDLPGIFTMRTRQDADRLRDFVNQGDEALIVGGGLLGLEMAASLHELNVKTHLIHRNARLMERQLDPLAGELLADQITEKGIQLFFNDEIESVIPDQEQLNVQFRSGRSVVVKALIYAIGTVPNIEPFKNIGLKTVRGVQVDPYLKTNDPNIFAIGEIAEFEGKMFGITAGAEEQADVVASFLSGDVGKFYKGTLSMNILKFPGIELCSLGEVNVNLDEDGVEEVLFIDRSSRYYKRCIIKNDKLIGAILMGDKSEFVEFKNLISSQLELSEKRLQLLRSNQKVEPVKGSLVCSCNNIGSGNLEDSIASGFKDMKSLCEATGAGLGCGSCKSEIRQILDQSLTPVE